jgi:hypothetical protein
VRTFFDGKRYYEAMHQRLPIPFGWVLLKQHLTQRKKRAEFLIPNSGYLQIYF